MHGVIGWDTVGKLGCSVLLRQSSVGQGRITPCNSVESGFGSHRLGCCDIVNPSFFDRIRVVRQCDALDLGICGILAQGPKRGACQELTSDVQERSLSRRNALLRPIDQLLSRSHS